MNSKQNSHSLSVKLGAAFLMATSAIGPGFLTQTSQFTAKYLASFAFVIACVISWTQSHRPISGPSSASPESAVRKSQTRCSRVSVCF